MRCANGDLMMSSIGVSDDETSASSCVETLNVIENVVGCGRGLRLVIVANCRQAVVDRRKADEGSITY